MAVRRKRRSHEVPAKVLSINGWAALSKFAPEVGYHANTLKRWGEKGLIKIKKVGGIYYVRPDEFERVKL